MAGTPRVLRIEFELRVPPGLPANIQAPRLESAVTAFTETLCAAAGRVFPWADRVQVRHSWIYEWLSDSETITLPATDKNTVDTAAAGPGDDPA